jgi:23S rRNA (adenine2503-C2)-methyltransferase
MTLSTMASIPATPPATTAPTIPSFFGLNADDIRELLASWGHKPYRAKQITGWYFTKRFFSLDQMSDVPTALRTQLQTDFTWHMPEIVSSLDSPDGATKLLLKSDKNQMIETVILRYEGRTALCVSSQVGCKLSCAFCQTGKLGFFRNLSTAEIIAQFALAEQIVQKEGRSITNVVFMGMGEPLDNFEAVVKAVKIMIDPEGFGLSHRKVTVSTSGLADKIRLLSEQTRVALAISLHACRDDLRNSLMPINRKFPLDDLKSAIKHYQKATDTKITFEYILIKDKNMGKQEAKELVQFAQGIPCKVNLIPFNAHPGMPFERPSQEEIDTFRNYLLERGFVTTVRYSKGGDVSGACGQLAAKSSENLEKAPQRKWVIGAH